MIRQRPPSGGLFRLQGPAPAPDAQPEARAEARDAIRHFVRVLERLDRDINSPSRPEGAPRKPARSRTAKGRPQ
jgi:hypothetical protein